MTTLTFYYHPATCALGVQIALLEVGVAHKTVHVDLAGDRSGYRKINPLGTVPALQTDAGVLTESTAIMSWLAQSYPAAGLLPADAYGLANGLSFLAWLSSSAHIARRQTKMPARFNDEPGCHAGIRESGARQFMLHLQRIDSRLQSDAYVLGGEKPSACDYQLMVYAHWCAIDGVGLSRFPNFERWLERMRKREAVQEALRVVDSPLLTR